MNKLKFTPGPWTVLDSAGPIKVVADSINPGSDELVANIHLDDSVAEANARLIAAAPEMYSLLKSCSYHIGGCDELSHAVEALLERVETGTDGGDCG